jgi:hypothetical protein
MTITRAHRRLIMAANAATLALSLVLWWRSGGWWLPLCAGAALVSLAMAAARVPDDDRRSRP